LLETAKLHLDVAVLAVACGFTRSVALQVGNGNDGDTRHRNLETGEYMENFHYLSHRRTAHGVGGDPIANADLLHHYVDVHFARTFGHLVSRLKAYTMPDGSRLLENGVAIWHNDLANGPPHGLLNIPHVIAGSAGGYFKQGECVEVVGGRNEPNHNKLLNTIGAAVGLTNASGQPLDDFGDPSLERGHLDELKA